eukprot:TRINITY_DN121767_c0_g1_i1.p1 TRINITY_DN121767_c0_g1~~TRINITY_DN121767_c0_g1_i1.p1  ORF type:complete len:192 (+),score=39.48 TRINITY_DN121767_c0_g1_i1:101-676(+)
MTMLRWDSNCAHTLDAGVDNDYPLGLSTAQAAPTSRHHAASCFAGRQAAAQGILDMQQVSTSLQRSADAAAQATSAAELARQAAKQAAYSGAQAMIRGRLVANHFQDDTARAASKASLTQGTREVEVLMKQDQLQNEDAQEGQALELPAVQPEREEVPGAPSEAGMPLAAAYVMGGSFTTRASGRPGSDFL